MSRMPRRLPAAGRTWCCCHCHCACSRCWFGDSCRRTRSLDPHPPSSPRPSALACESCEQSAPAAKTRPCRPLRPCHGCARASKRPVQKRAARWSHCGPCRCWSAPRRWPPRPARRPTANEFRWQKVGSCTSGSPRPRTCCRPRRPGSRKPRSSRRRTQPRRLCANDCWKG